MLSSTDLGKAQKDQGWSRGCPSQTLLPDPGKTRHPRIPGPSRSCEPWRPRSATPRALGPPRDGQPSQPPHVALVPGSQLCMLREQLGCMTWSRSTGEERGRSLDCRVKYLVPAQLRRGFRVLGAGRSMAEGSVHCSPGRSCCNSRSHGVEVVLQSLIVLIISSRATSSSYQPSAGESTPTASTMSSGSTWSSVQKYA